jgi:hypothetical protein
MWKEKASACSARNDGFGDCGVRSEVRETSWVLLAKNDSAQFIAEPLGFGGVGGVAKALGDFEKFLLCDLFRVDALAYRLVSEPHSTNMHENGAVI